jgi:hypothetical protein
VLFEQAFPWLAVRELIDPLNPPAEARAFVWMMGKLQEDGFRHLNRPLRLSEYMGALVLEQPDGILNP